ncbi:MAG: helix-turn-helix domain-containing protein [Eubacteriales bacterium]
MAHQLVRAGQYLENDRDISVLLAEVPAHHLRHEHDFIEIAYIVSGKGVHVIGDDRIPTGKGDIFLLDAHVPHEYFAEEGSPLLVCNCVFQPPAVSDSFRSGERFLDWAYHSLYQPSLSAEGPKDYVKLLGTGGHEFENILDIMYAECHNRREGTGQVVRANLIILLVTLFRLYDSTPDRSAADAYYRRHIVQNTTDYIREHYKENIRCEDLAEHCFLSVSHFSRIFREVTGTTALNVLRDYRIEISCDLLLYTQMPISEVANSVGYTDMKHFYRLFRKIKGVTPGEYRKQMIEMPKKK